jgi:hypothetical protein
MGPALEDAPPRYYVEGRYRLGHVAPSHGYCEWGNCSRLDDAQVSPAPVPPRSSARRRAGAIPTRGNRNRARNVGVLTARDDAVSAFRRRSVSKVD